MVQENICHTYIHHKFIMQANRHENLFFASYGFKDLSLLVSHNLDIFPVNVLILCMFMIEISFMRTINQKE